MNLSIGVNVELTDVLEAYDGGSFQWYFSVVESFNGTEPIFPFPDDQCRICKEIRHQPVPIAISISDHACN
jgi:hypothetical protein